MHVVDIVESRNFRLLIGVYVCIFALLSVPYSASAADGRVALVIGNDDYRNISTLKKAVNDARAMKAVLESLHFQVIYAENATLSEMKNLGFKFSNSLDEGDIGFVFYAGHGANLRGANLLLPVDIPAPADKIYSKRQKRSEELRLSGAALPETFFMDRTRDAGARVGILVLDACRNNPLRITVESATRDGSTKEVVFGTSRGLRKKDNPVNGFYTFYSAGYGESALDKLRHKPDYSLNSPFTRVFAKNLQIKGMDFDSIAKKTRLEVFEIAKADLHSQTPSIYEQILSGKIYLNGENPEDVKIASTHNREFPEPKSKWYMTAYQDLDFWGRDIIAEGIAVDNLEQCARECALENQCKHFTYNVKQSHCFLKSGYDFAVKSEGAVSGYIYEEKPGTSFVAKNAEFRVSYRQLPNVEFGGLFLKKRYQPAPDLADFSACLEFCERTSFQCNYLTFNNSKKSSRKCTVRKTDFSLRQYTNSRATSFVRVNEIARPDIGPVFLPIENRLTSGLPQKNWVD